MSLGAAWIVVFVLMLVDQYQVGRGLSVAELILGLRNGHRFGDMTLQELVSGEIWRTLTSTFVHYGLLHIGLNLYAFYQLGCLVESWYGAGQFLGIYVVTGGGGNLLSGLVRDLTPPRPDDSLGRRIGRRWDWFGLCAVVDGVPGLTWASTSRSK
ncbi:MAG: rhomboid family intramembrane serine protease [Isosphaeraceae bacterium]